MIRFAILGYGFIGAVHAATLKKVDDAQVVAVIEKDKSKWGAVTRGNIDVNGMGSLDVPFFESIAQMQDNVEADCISVCLPTFLHRSFAEQAMAAGMHVVCEKPMALTLNDCDAMIAATRASGKQLFIAQCIRFWPEYVELKRMHDSGLLGAPLSFRFQRLSGMPTWGGENSWFMQEDKSGGCLFDLHVHDIDFVNTLLGKPRALYARGVKLANSNAAVVSQYHYENNLLCTIEGSWLSFSGFKMSYTAVYENGQLEYDSTQSPALKLWKKGAAEPEAVHVAATDGYTEQYNYFVDCLKSGKAPALVPPESTRLSIELALAERESIEKGSVIEL
ncbi:Gfo/Idh/MocA family oxidoreductase [candidate division KSB1 bacterium]|nr:Gfo/Idh/MocA family oxidoreductase [candidate division KSB1 bacterium]RQW08779.1 MAG: gfo/Idh/MocA family oxidoreductase [candidate division KSB1 bacterium]